MFEVLDLIIVPVRKAMNLNDPGLVTCASKKVDDETVSSPITPVDYITELRCALGLIERRSMRSSCVDPASFPTSEPQSDTT